MKVKEILEKRQAELLDQIKPLKELEKELRQVQKALIALDDSSTGSCNKYCEGCDICRRGPQYR